MTGDAIVVNWRLGDGEGGDRRRRFAGGLSRRRVASNDWLSISLLFSVVAGVSVFCVMEASVEVKSDGDCTGESLSALVVPSCLITRDDTKASDVSTLGDGLTGEIRRRLAAGSRGL